MTPSMNKTSISTTTFTFQKKFVVKNDELNKIK